MQLSIESSSLGFPPSQSRPRKPDELWDEMEVMFGRVPERTSAHGKRNKACGDLRRMGATPETLRRARLAYLATFPDAPLTDTALAVHYPLLMQPQSEAERKGWERKRELEERFQ